MTEFQVRPTRAASEFEEAYEDENVIRGAIFTEPLGKVPRRPLVTVPHIATVTEAIRAMNDSHTGCALVVHGEKLVGIFTERDVLTKVAGKGLPAAATVETVMTRDPDTLPETALIAYALRHMSVEGYRHIPLVTADGRPVAVVGLRDIVAWICGLFPASVLNLPPSPSFPRTTDGG